MAKKQHSQNLYCFPDGLQAKLAQISEHGLTVVEAPSGFGKTTAVREYLASEFDATTRVQWYTCLGESPAKAWAGICSLFGSTDSSLAEELMELGPPAAQNLADIATLLRTCSCDRISFFIIDNYQLFEHAAPRKFLAALSTCQIKNLHLVVITQPLKDEPQTTHSPHHHIGTQDFYFGNACIAKFCHQTGLKISAESIEQIQAVADGWIAAIRLQLRSYKESGCFLSSKDINTLVETAIWSKLSGEEKHFLVAVSLLDGFTARQAAIMGDGESMPGSIATLLSLEFFMRYVADKKVYSMHSILREYLLQRFTLQPPAVMDAMHRKAAAACLEVRDYYQAAVFLMHVRDHEAILSLPFSTEYLYNNKDRGLVDFFRQVVDTCPPHVLQKYPVFLVLIAYLFYRNGEAQYFFKLTDMLRTLFESRQELPGQELERAKAEFYMLISFTEYNDIIKMSAWHRKAYAVLQTLPGQPRSIVFQGSMPWAVGVASYLSVYWNTSGQLQQELDAMDECLPIYSELASGHGAGAEHVFRAEALLACGQDVEAEALCHKATYRASDAEQFGVCLCAEVALAQIAIMRGDAAAYAATRVSITRTATASGQRSVMRMGELCLVVLNLCLGITDGAPLWLFSVEGIRKALYAHAVPYGLMVHGHLLLHEGRIPPLRGLAALLDSLSRSTMLSRNMNYVLLQVYRDIYLAVAELKARHQKKAEIHLDEALNLALPDRVYLPFAEHAETLLPLLERLKAGFNDSRMEECISLCRRWAAGVAAVRREQTGTAAVLSPREREIALLIREGLSAGQIAARLFLAESTVASVRKEIYRKLDIHSKMELARVKL